MGIKSYLRRIRRWRIACWLPTGLNAEGEPTYAPPIEIRGRWEDYFVEEWGADGRQFKSRARVFVDRDLPLGTVLKRPPDTAQEGDALLALNNLVGTSPFEEEVETYRVRKMERLPLRRPGETNFHWTAVLSGRND